MSDGALRLVAYTAVYVGDDIHRDLARIGASSHRNNVGAGITGALLFDGGRFIQALEGPDGAVEALLTRVRGDARAADMDVLFDRRTQSRSLQDWTMRVCFVRETPMLAGRELAAFRDAYLRNFKPDADGFIALLRGLVEADEGSPDIGTSGA